MNTTHIQRMITAIFLTTTLFGAVNAETALAQSLPASLPNEYKALLPAGYEVPENLPATIVDPLLLTAWVYIYNHTEQFEINDGLKISGRGLAELVFEYSIPVNWSTEKDCKASSCAKRTLCQDKDCVAKFQRKGGEAIYITRELNSKKSKDFAFLVKTLAHELYHQTLPFGPVGSSLYEEYWGFYVGTQISQAGWMEFAAYNPLKAACLKRFFIVYGLGYYEGFEAFPFTLKTAVDVTSKTCQ